MKNSFKFLIHSEAFNLPLREGIIWAHDEFYPCGGHKWTKLIVFNYYLFVVFRYHSEEVSLLFWVF